MLYHRSVDCGRAEMLCCNDNAKYMALNRKQFNYRAIEIFGDNDNANGLAIF